MKSAPPDLLELVKTTASPEAEIIPLTWGFEVEDDNIAMVMPDTTDRLTARLIEDQLIDAIIDWDAAHHTLTLCKVWRQHEITRVGVL